ncbi:tripartite tricarboxylate transporter substrate binding protein [Variovorax paradoxus]|uniref:Bug family tripartite tricarboxylate transporter substrate binding protein n=1 Tax=Variovorax paradoxus TaxID=34073 RepID=UPI0021AD24BA|nr:tripartite tricarboxylate transporter substrate binding protein [Variovorax paradoxus]UVH60652.1 tripartite tricarboxylate transporter substrate binding protein [Variovorax paradoxus]
MNHRRAALVLILSAAASIAATAASAQSYPTKPIKIVVPQPAGSGPDTLARTLADVLGKSLNQSVVVENRPGANGTLAANYVISQPADGYTLFLAGVSNMSWNPHLYKSLSHQPARDFAGVAVIANTPFVTAVAPGLGIKTLPDLIKMAKAEPTRLSYASAGIGNSTHLATELLKSRTGIQMQHVPISGAGGPTALTSVMAGDTPVITTVPVGVVPQVKAGKLIALAVTGEHRLSQLPDVPTFKELGIEMEVPGWYSIVTRTGTPADVIARLNMEINKALDTAEMKERLNGQMLTAIKSAPADVLFMTKRDSVAWGPVIERLGISQ